VAAAFDTAYANIAAFHKAQQTAPIEVETMAGVRCRRESRPIGAVGLYVPGGTAVLPSSALMLAVPAAIAGCRTIVLATPPRPDGSVTPEVLYCARKAGVTHVLKAGGAQAVAAMAWGTASCPKVDKILGPGNQYVTAAKMLLQNSEAMVAIDMPAGPSEVLVIADAGAHPTHVAIDLLSQVRLSRLKKGEGVGGLCVGGRGRWRGARGLCVCVMVGPRGWGWGGDLGCCEVLCACLPAAMPSFPVCAGPLFWCTDSVPLLVAQAEHGPDSQAVLLALPGVDVEAVQQEVERQCSLLPRAETTRRALTHSCIVQVGSKEEAAQFSNRSRCWLMLRGRGCGRRRERT
jgi:histidinol dehydrogenase